jgi:DNA-binding IclR family transcriptional regulator
MAPRGSNGVQSAVTVLEVLSAFIGAESMPMLKTLAERTGMHPAKVHRYLVSLCQAGYVEQDEESSRYRLGPAALRLGFAAMEMIDSLRIARPLMLGFRQSLQNTVVFAIWSQAGPSVAVIDSLPGVLTITTREGTVLPILRSSIGRVFGAWMPRPSTEQLIKAELQSLRTNPLQGVPSSMEEVENLFVSIRTRGFARVTGQLSPMAHSFAAPVWGASGQIAGVLAVLGPTGQFDSTWNSPIAKQLLQFAAVISHRLGFQGEHPVR